jgi:hypothetical protein
MLSGAHRFTAQQNKVYRCVRLARRLHRVTQVGKAFMVTHKKSASGDALSCFMVCCVTAMRQALPWILCFIAVQD